MGDKQGHPFHGNQYRDGANNLTDSGRRMDDLYATAILAWHGGPHWEKDLGESEYIVSVGVLHV